LGQALPHHPGSHQDNAPKLRTEIAMLNLIEERRAGLDHLCRHHHVSRLELFGSAVSGEFDAEASDLDFLVEFQPLAPGDRADADFGLSLGLEDLFARKIDLVTIRAIRNPWFRRAVDRQRENSMASCFGLAVAESAESAPCTALALPPRSGGWARCERNASDILPLAFYHPIPRWGQCKLAVFPRSKMV
jgi:predicted nucleotidyltransferase